MTKTPTMLAAAAAALMAFAGPSRAEVPIVEPIMNVTDVTGPSTTLRICTGAAGGAYFTKASQMLGLVQAATKLPVTVEPGGGTVGCLRKLAAGQAEAAIVQLDSLVWLKRTSPLYARIAPAAQVLVEEMAAVCNRISSVEDLNDIAQRRDSVIAIAGGAESGSLLTMNVLAGFDPGFDKPTYQIAGGWDAALSSVKAGMATCAFGVMSVDADSWRDLNDTFGSDLRMVGFWDGNMRDLEIAGRQVYGWLPIPKETKTLDEFLDWNGKGKLWSPEVGVVPALVVYRTDMLPNAGPALTSAAGAVATAKVVRQ